MDVWVSQYDSVFRVVRVSEESGVVIGLEYDYILNGVVFKRLLRCIFSEVVREEDLLEIFFFFLYKVVVLLKGQKGIWKGVSVFRFSK